MLRDPHSDSLFERLSLCRNSDSHSCASASATIPPDLQSQVRCPPSLAAHTYTAHTKFPQRKGVATHRLYRHDDCRARHFLVDCQANLVIRIHENGPCRIGNFENCCQHKLISDILRIARTEEAIKRLLSRFFGRRNSHAAKKRA